MIEFRWRYGMYGALAAGATVLYIALDGGPAGDGGRAAGGGWSQASLPPLNSLHEGGQSTVRRDLFALPLRPPPAAVIVEDKGAPPPPPVDRLAEIQVLGVVKQRGHRAILVKAGNDVVTIVAGERFGMDEALEIDMIEEGQIRVSDRVANVSKTFNLSEE